MIIHEKANRCFIWIVGGGSILVVTFIGLFLVLIPGRSAKFIVKFEEKGVSRKRNLKAKAKTIEHFGKEDYLGTVNCFRGQTLILGQKSWKGLTPSGYKKSKKAMKKMAKAGAIGAWFLAKRLLAVESRSVVDVKEEDRIIRRLKSIGPPAIPPLCRIICGGKRIPFGVKTMSFSMVLYILVARGDDGLRDAMKFFERAFASKDRSVRIAAISIAKGTYWGEVLKRSPWLEGIFEKVILGNIFRFLLNGNKTEAQEASNFVIGRLSKGGMKKYWRRMRKALAEVLPFLKKDVGGRIKWLVGEMDMRVPLK